MTAPGTKSFGGKTVTESNVGYYYTNYGRDRHPVSWSADYAVADSYGARSPIVHGDRIHAESHFVEYSQVTSDQPFVLTVDGSNWWNGPYHADKTFYMSRWLTNTVFNPSDGDVWLNSGMTSKRYDSIQKVLVRLNRKVVDQKINMAENIATAAKTLDMVAKPFVKTLQAYRYVRSGQYGRAASILGKPREWINGRKVSDLWLQYYYGWKPLVSDVHTGLELLFDTHRDKGFLTKVRASENVSDSYSVVDGWFTHRMNMRSTIRGGYLFYVRNERLAFYNRYGIGNPISLVWELAPYSFVTDWFLPVGDILEGLAAGSGIDFVTGYYNVKDSTESLISISPGTNEVWFQGDAHKVTKPGLLRREGSKFERVALGSLPVPDLYLKSNPFSTQHVASALALLRKGL